MPTHSAYLSQSEFQTGSVISVDAKSIVQGDVLSIEYPNNSRVSGTVVSALPNEFEIRIDTATWRLRPHAPSDGTVHNNLAGADASFWTVQTKI